MLPGAIQTVWIKPSKEIFQVLFLDMLGLFFRSSAGALSRLDASSDQEEEEAEEEQAQGQRHAGGLRGRQDGRGPREAEGEETQASRERRRRTQEEEEREEEEKEQGRQRNELDCFFGFFQNAPFHFGTDFNARFLILNV